MLTRNPQCLGLVGDGVPAQLERCRGASMPRYPATESRAERPLMMMMMTTD